jgi:hypothetical protein
VEPVRPEVEATGRAGDGPCHHTRIAEDQPEYLAIDGALVRTPATEVARCLAVPWQAAIVHFPPGGAPTHLLAFRPTPEQRARLAAGDDVYIGLLTFGGPMTPLVVLCGKDEAAATFGVVATDPQPQEA